MTSPETYGLELWLGMFEMVYRVPAQAVTMVGRSKEGPGDVRPNLPLGPTPILRQTSRCPMPMRHRSRVALSIAASGSDLHGRYIFGDWITRRFWAFLRSKCGWGADRDRVRLM